MRSYYWASLNKQLLIWLCNLTWLDTLKGLEHFYPLADFLLNKPKIDEKHRFYFFKFISRRSKCILLCVFSSWDIVKLRTRSHRFSYQISESLSIAYRCCSLWHWCGYIVNLITTMKGYMRNIHWTNYGPDAFGKRDPFANE